MEENVILSDRSEAQEVEGPAVVFVLLRLGRVPQISALESHLAALRVRQSLP